MMDDRASTEYKLIIKICDQKKCAEYDPFGLCYVDDCMSCIRHILMNQMC